MNLQDFSMINTKVQKIREENNLKSSSDAFYYIVISEIADLQDDEIEDAITDNTFLTNQGTAKGHDRGIDAIYIDEEKEVPVVHLFNCKYTESFEKAKTSNYPSNEIDKIGDYMRVIMNMDRETIEDSNKILKEKTEEIWNLFERSNPMFKIHLCSNYENGLQEQEKSRLERILGGYSNIEIIEHVNSNYVKLINDNKRVFANAKFRASQKEMFEKSDGDIRALIVNISAEELVRIITDDEEYRNKIDLEDYTGIKEKKILEDIFYDNVRVYKRNRSKINENMKETAKSDEKNKFFYYNNGITITCKSFEYSKISQPVISMGEIQVVNGCQTLHALFEIAQEDIENLKDIEILCRIYELKNSLYSSYIAEYTNSQNPVTTRDIRAIDPIQQKLETELLNKGYFYERKKNQYDGKPKNKRIDSEKIGQALMACYNKMPNEAKNDKKLIFGNKYDNVFNSNINADKVLYVYNLYEDIEKKRQVVKKQILEDETQYEDKAYILYSSYYIMYILARISEIKNIKIIKENFERYYNISVLLLKKAILQEKRNNPSKYSNADFFKSTRVKTYIDIYFERIGKEITKERVNRLRITEVK